MAQFVVIVEVFVAKRNAKDALANERDEGMLNAILIASIAETASKSLNQADRFVGCAQQKRARIRRDRTTIERGDYLASFNGSKFNGISLTLCRHRGAPSFQLKSFHQNNFR